ncbi:MAG: hypothetical protein HYY37_03390 [Candidatus Aenigmarchaeota archaeon]|nr:hypothetical protein [Candidatus Aenigmarchaeota archaeon]
MGQIVVGQIVAGTRKEKYGSGTAGFGTTGPGSTLEAENTARADDVLLLEDSAGLCEAQPTTTGLTWSCSPDARLTANARNASDVGLRLIRKELRDTPKKSTIYDRSRRAARNPRNALLALYDTVAKKEYDISGKMRTRAGEYYTAYKEAGGSGKWEELENDFILIACASVHGIDIVVSEDEKTMLTENAVRAYKLMNSIYKRRTPDFIGYERFKAMITR